jgi:type III restriction enzyme
MGRKTTSSQTIDFPFYTYLGIFIEQNRKKIYSAFKPLTRKLLNFNNPKENSGAFLRKPQFEALEVYAFLKEFCDNKQLWQIFEEWYNRTDVFEGREFAGRDKYNQLTLFGPSEDGRSEATKETFATVFQQIKGMEQIYPNYIFALTMGIGKTVLMATSIFYEFILANKYPNDEHYCHNALVFAPDKTVLQSLKEIITFDKSKVIPSEYLSWLEANLKFHFLEESGDSLNTIDMSDYNVIISNTQKIILKHDRKGKTPTENLFGADNSYKIVTSSRISKIAELAKEAGIDDINSEMDMIVGGRFQKILRLKQLGIYVDEAHHVFGTKLSDDLMSTTKATSLRVTINEIAKNLNVDGSRVVSCFNYTGTPYIGNRLLPEVVYSYGLRDAIDHSYLKKVDIKGYENVKEKTQTFCRIAINRFWDVCGEKRVENMLPKMAFFASSIDELQNELRPAVEKVLGELNIPISKILVNVGDEKLTKNDDLREFKNLDSPMSDKQFILLVNKGKEGWNCRSLFSVALNREPKSKIFVLQATMRCLRQIGDYQHTALVFLSDENTKILDDELQKNFNMTLDDMDGAGDNPNKVDIKIVPPKVKLQLSRVSKMFKVKKKVLDHAVDFDLQHADIENYKIIETKRSIDDMSKKLGPEKDVSKYDEKKIFSSYMLIAEIAKYLNMSPFTIKQILNDSVEGLKKITEAVNTYNQLLYDVIIPKLFSELFDIEEFDKKETKTIDLVKEPDSGFYTVKYKDGLKVSLDDSDYNKYKNKTFNVDNYCFDSQPEKDMFDWLLRQQIDKVWFTGMLTNNQTEFRIYYIDPESGGVRSYYPDFLVRKNDGKYLIIEVKGDNMIDDATVLAKKEYAERLALANNMEYQMIKGSEAKYGIKM